MKQYVNAYSTANTIRMVSGVGRSVFAMLAHDVSASAQIYNTVGDNYYVITSISAENFFETIQLLRKDNWNIARRSFDNITESSGGSPNVRSKSGWPSAKTEYLEYGNFLLVVFTRKEEELETPLERIEGLIEQEPIQTLPPPNSEGWLDRNDRRIFLIKKKTREELTPSEALELHGLQTEMLHELNQEFPLPFEKLESLEQYILKAERRSGSK